MNLNKLVLDKIKELGPTQAAGYFGVSVPTIYSWQKKKNAPVTAAQKVLDEIPMEREVVPETAEEIPPPEAEVAPEVVAGEQAIGTTDEMPLTLESLDYRVRKLEVVVATNYDRARAVRTPSLINPLAPPNSGMQIKSQPVVIGEKPPNADVPQHWNDPKPGSTPKKGGGWNEPVRPATQDGGRAHNWNAPMPRKQEQAQ